MNNWVCNYKLVMTIMLFWSVFLYAGTGGVCYWCPSICSYDNNNARILYICIWEYMYIVGQNNNNSKSMGSKPCKQCHQNVAESQAYGSYQVLQQGTQLYALVEKKIQKSPHLQEQLARKLQVRQKIDSIHLARLIKYSIREESYGYKVSMMYEYVPKTLRDRINEVKLCDQFFTEREIYAVMYGVQTALEQLKKHKIKHCCVNLDTILVRNSLYKLTDVSSTTYVTSYELCNRGIKQQFLSPRLLQRLKHESLHPVYSYQDDMFSLGMILIISGTMQQPSSFYQWTSNHEGSVNIKRITDGIKFISKKYSKRLAKQVKNLVWWDQGHEESSNSILTTKIDQEVTQIMMKANSLNSTSITPEKSDSVIKL